MTVILFQTSSAMCMAAKSPGRIRARGQYIRQQQKTDTVHYLRKTRSLFFHPDYTVGPGVSPSQPPKRVADFTASREFHPAPKNIVVIQLLKVLCCPSKHLHYISLSGTCKSKSSDAEHKFPLVLISIDLLNVCADLAELLREVLVTSFNKLDIEDLAVIVGSQGCDHKSCSRSQVR